MEENSEIPKNWVSTKLGEIIELAYGKSLPKNHRNLSGKFPVYGSNGIVDYHDNYLIKGPSIIVGRKGAAGIPTFSLNDCWPIDTTYFVLDSKNYDLRFIYYLLINLRLNHLDRSTAIPGLNRDDAYSLDILLPPLQEQHRIVAKIEALFSELDKGIESFKTAREQLKIYRQALLKHAFSGKLTEQWRAENAGELESAETLLQRIQTERQQRYQQQLKDWQDKSPSIPFLQRGKPGLSTPEELSTIKEVPPFEKGGLGGISKPKPPKTLPPLTVEELAESPELPVGWSSFMLGDICLEAVLGKMLDKEKNKGDFKPYLRNINVRWSEFNLDNLLEMRFEESELVRYGLQDGDLIVCEGGEPGRCAVWKKEFGQNMQIQKALHRIRFSHSINSAYVQKFFEFSAFNRKLEKLFTGTTIKHLTGEKLARMAIPVCSIAEQNQILSELDAKFSEVDQLDQTITTALQQAEALRQSILKKAFSGQLVPQDPNDEPASVLLERIRAEKAQADKQPARRRGKTA